MPRTAWYIDWFNSPFYYTLYEEKNEKAAADFVQHLIAYLKPAPGSSILDAGCGQGLYSKILASSGFDVTGTDISVTAINHAKQFEKENLQFYMHDMRLPFRIHYFDYVFNFSNRFGYFRTKREHDDAIRTLCSGLKENGRIVIDYLNVHYMEKELIYKEEKHLNSTTYLIRQWDDATHFYKKIGIEDPSLLHPLEFAEETAKFTLEDFTEMLSYRGMQVEGVFGDRQLHPYDVEKTPRMIIVAKKIKS